MKYDMQKDRYYALPYDSCILTENATTKKKQNVKNIANYLNTLVVCMNISWR